MAAASCPVRSRRRVPARDAARRCGASATSSRSSGRPRKLSLRRLAEEAGVSNPYLSQIERGLRKPSAEILQQLAKALRISAEQLYVQAGLLEDRGTSQAVEAAVVSDAAITERQKRVLLDIYASFLVRERGARRCCCAGVRRPGRAATKRTVERARRPRRRRRRPRRRQPRPRPRSRRRRPQPARSPRPRSPRPRDPPPRRPPERPRRGRPADHERPFHAHPAHPPHSPLPRVAGRPARRPGPGAGARRCR